MDLNDMVLFSVDDHVIEPPDLFEGREPAKYAGRFPKLTEGDDGIARWIWEGDAGGNASLNAVVTWPKSQWNLDPATLAEMRPGCYDIAERVDDMNVNGVAVSMCFPTFARFGGGFFSECDDKDLALAVVQAYNDWHIESWCGAFPGRFLPLAIPVAWDPELSAKEVRRVAKMGAKSVCFTENPTKFYQLPSIYSGHWDPFFEACVDEGLVISIHIGSSGILPTTSPDAPIDIPVTLATMLGMEQVMDYLYSDTFVKFPDLKIAMSEAGAGWIPYVLDRLDRHAVNQRWTGQRFSEDLLPSQVFREHFLCCMVSDAAGLALRDRIGIDILAVETDYPHSDSQWPHAPEVFMRDFEEAGVTDEEIELLTWKNAARFYDFDPFAVQPREELTVGALRAQATHIDTSTTTKEEYRARYAARAAASA
ncbi:MAG: amidohydrolase family protein [Acidimicrobiia bacterium]